MSGGGLKSVARLSVIAFAISTFAAGQSAPPTNQAADAAKIVKVKEVLQLSHALENTTKVMRDMMAKQKRQLPLPTAAQDDFERMFFEKVNGQSVIEIAVPIYMDAFTSEELDQIIAFYKTPLGQKLLEKGPQIAVAMMNKCGELGRQAGLEVGTEIERKLKAGDYGPWPPDASKSSSSPAQDQAPKK